ncbi:hypothetical protein [Spirosoma validum]|uniref:Uncharacterized protein n=1 Tax=Spirosoma validum TaxID=2771355 RepID=A0A927B899_9BACT|nr:hypothetical protein [Spirosoma validum]MBD2756987.1 hypothetical protein [Spirosoma validum]
MEFIVLLLLLVLASLLIVATAVANHLQAELNQQSKAEYEVKLLIQKQRYQLDDLQRNNRFLVAENRALKEQRFRIQREQLLASLN